MLQRVVCTGLLLVLAVGGGTAGDLYLLKIENAAQLEAAERILPSAHGVLGERFLVDMTDDQAEILKMAGLETTISTSA